MNPHGGARLLAEAYDCGRVRTSAVLRPSLTIPQHTRAHALVRGNGHKLQRVDLTGLCAQARQWAQYRLGACFGKGFDGEGRETRTPWVTRSTPCICDCHRGMQSGNSPLHYKQPRSSRALAVAELHASACS